MMMSLSHFGPESEVLLKRRNTSIEIFLEKLLSYTKLLVLFISILCIFPTRSAAADTQYIFQSKDFKIDADGGGMSRLMSFSCYGSERFLGLQDVDFSRCIVGNSIISISAPDLPGPTYLSASEGITFNLNSDAYYPRAIPTGISFCISAPAVALKPPLSTGIAYAVVTLSSPTNFFQYGVRLQSDPQCVQFAIDTANFPGIVRVGISESAIGRGRPTDPPFPSLTVDNIVVNFASTPTPTHSVAISNVHVTQAVQDFKLSGGPADYDLVLGKSTAIAFDVATTDGSTQNGLSVSAKLSDGSVSLSDANIIVGPVPQTIMLPAFVPQNASSNISLMISATGTNIQSSQVTKTLRIKKTKNLNLTYLPFSTVSSSINASDFDSHVTQSSSLIGGMFPVADNAVIVVSGSSQSASENTSVISAKFNKVVRSTRMTALNEDLKKISEISAATKSSALGIVPDSYFSDHNMEEVFGYANEPAVATAFRPIGALTRVNYWDVTVHELAHTFGISHSPNAPKVSSYWAQRGRLIDQLLDLMLDYISPVPRRLLNSWISGSEYQSLFKQLLVNPADPKVLLVSGFLHKDGSVSLDPILFLPNGIATPFDSTTDGVVKALGSDGTVLAQSSFISSFNLLFSTGDLVPTDESIFVLQLPRSEGATTIEVSENGKTLASINPNSQLLLDTIKQISDASFNNNPRKERSALLEQAERIEKTLKACQHTSKDRDDDRMGCARRVVSKILDLRESIDKKLNDSTEKIDPLQLTKAEVLRSIDEVITTKSKFTYCHRAMIEMTISTSVSHQLLKVQTDQ
jgi:hypothetical protein